MKIVIATPLYPPEIGGPATYAKNLEEGLSEQGNDISLVKFSDVCRYPKLIRHAAYFWQVLRALRDAEVVIAFDTWSTGIPALLAAKVSGKKILVRIGGDFLWESYIERTHTLVRLSEFYTQKRIFSYKEHLIFRGAKWITRSADTLVFNTVWQRDLWQGVYTFDSRKTVIIENEYPEVYEQSLAQGRVFVAAGRPHFLKNLQLLETVFADLKSTFPDIELDTRVLSPLEHEMRIRNAYAMVIPSVSEVSSNTAIDALRFGKPFIMSSDTGARERMGNVGIFIDTLNPGALRQALEKILDPKEYARALERIRTFTFLHSREEVIQEFSTALHTLCAS